MRMFLIGPDPDVALAIFRVTGGNPELSETGTSPVPVVVTSDDVTVLGPAGVSIVFMIWVAGGVRANAYAIASLVVAGDVAITVLTPCESVIVEGVVGSRARRVGIAPITSRPVLLNPSISKTPEYNANDEPMLYAGVLTTKIPVPSILQIALNG
jgi:hypothetical protein